MKQFQVELLDDYTDPVLKLNCSAESFQSVFDAVLPNIFKTLATISIEGFSDKPIKKITIQELDD